MLRRVLWDRLGGFDESLPACEDYDLWLRLTLMTPVALLPERLIVKRGGHADQLSRSVPILDQYRITGLEKILTASLTEGQRHAVLEQVVRKCQIVELRFFGGCGVEETGRVLGVSISTVVREWDLAKTWLFRELTKDAD